MWADLLPIGNKNLNFKMYQIRMVAIKNKSNKYIIRVIFVNTYQSKRILYKTQ